MADIAPGGGSPRRETTTIVAKASGTDHSAGCASSSAGTPGSSPATSPAAITPAELTSPTAIPTSAPRAVSRRHQIPSTSSGQNVDAATANADVTSAPTSTRAPGRASSTTTAAAT